jgi:hypothetical protein
MGKPKFIHSSMRQPLDSAQAHRSDPWFGRAFPGTPMGAWLFRPVRRASNPLLFGSGLIQIKDLLADRRKRALDREDFQSKPFH